MEADSLPAEELARIAGEMAVYDALPAALREIVGELGFQGAGGYTVLKKAAAQEGRRLRSLTVGSR